MQKYKIRKEGGKLHGFWPFLWVGYKTVHDDQRIKILTCRGEGILECKHHTDLGLGSSYTDHMNMVYDDVTMKVYNDEILCGTESYNFQNSDDGVYYYCSATWTATETEPDKYDIDIEVTCTEAPEPLN